MLYSLFWQVKLLNIKMKIQTRFLRGFLFLFVFLTLHGTRAQMIEIKDAQNAAKTLRDFYVRRDFDGGYEAGRALVERFPENVELRAWFVLNEARSGLSAEAVEAAEKLVERDDKNAWAWFALAHARVRRVQKDEALAAAENALRLAPKDEEFIFLYASALLMHKRFDEIYALLDKNSANIKDAARLLYVKAEARYRQSAGAKIDEAARRKSFEDFAAAVAANPQSINANFIYGFYLDADKRFAEAVPFLKKAAALSPDAISIREELWKAIENQTSDNAARRTAEILADAENFSRTHPDSPNVLAAVAAENAQLKMTARAEEYENRLLKIFSDSKAAETLLAKRLDREYFAQLNAGLKDEAAKRKLARLLLSFINRPRRFSEEYHSNAYARFLSLIRGDKTFTEAELLAAAERLTIAERDAPVNNESDVAFRLVERGLFADAERFARAGVAKTALIAEKRRADSDGKNRFQESDSEMSAAFSALGYVFQKQKRFDEAEREFLKAAETNPRSIVAQRSLGEIYEERKDFDRSEQSFVSAVALFYTPDEKFEDFRRIYAERGGKPDGFDSYLIKIKTLLSDKRRQTILSERARQPAPAVAFNLAAPDGKRVSLESMRGKIVVVNFWGTWCAPCVRELPDVQAFYKKYAGDKDVVFLTVNNDNDNAKLDKFMKRGGYDFPVLLDDNYIDRAGVDVFPTTWFIDRAGRISFVKTGFSPRLAEEFSWRVEELKK